MNTKEIKEIKELLNDETLLMGKWELDAGKWELDAGDWVAYTEELVDEVESLNKRITELEERLADADKAIAELVDAVKAKDALLVCYRINKRPTEKLFRRLEKANSTLKKHINKGEK